MSFAVPTLADLLDRTRKAFRAHLAGTDAWLWPNNINPTAKVFSGGLFELFGFASYVSKMIFVRSTPDLETLIRHGAEYGLTLRPASPAGGVALFTSTGALTVNDGAVLRRSDGAEYRVVAGGVLLGAGTLSLAIAAAVDGAASNALDGVALAIASGVTGEATVVASGDVVGGADVEDIETFRARILFRKRNPPHGGAAPDYVQWAMEVPGVTRVFVVRDPPEVRVYPMFDFLRPNGIPTPDDVAAVEDHLALVAPATAIVTVVAATAFPVNVSISGLSPDTTAVREAIAAELRSAFYRLGRVSGVDVGHPSMPFLATPATFSRSWLWQAVANATGEDRHVLLAPAADVTVPTDRIATLGTIAYE